MFHPTAIVDTADVGEGTRIWAYAHVMPGAKIGANCNIGDHVFIEGGAEVGDNVTIKNGVALWEGVRLEAGVFVGPYAVFTNDRYPRSPRVHANASRYSKKDWREKIVVEEGATIGANATVLCGIRIGRYALVGAGALVTRDVAPHALVLGVPARQAAWVCYCGRPLARTDDKLVCVHCGNSFDPNELKAGASR